MVSSHLDAAHPAAFDVLGRPLPHLLPEALVQSSLCPLELSSRSACWRWAARSTQKTPLMLC